MQNAEWLLFRILHFSFYSVCESGWLFDVLSGAARNHKDVPRLIRGQVHNRVKRHLFAHEVQKVGYRKLRTYVDIANLTEVKPSIAICVKPSTNRSRCLRRSDGFQMYARDG